MTLADDQAVALAQEYPASTETSVTALLQQWKVDNAVEDWADYVQGMHNIAAFAGNPQTHFIDAQAVAWAEMAATP